MKNQLNNINQNKLDNDHPLKHIDLENIIPDQFILEEIVQLEYLKLFLPYFIEQLHFEFNLGESLDKSELENVLLDFFDFLLNNQENLSIFVLVQNHM